MFGKDDRSKSNRKNMHQHSHYHKQQRRGGGAANGTSSSSPQVSAVRSVVDIANSSDEPRIERKGWSSSVAPQRNREALDTMPSTDIDDLMDLGIDTGPLDENSRMQLRAGDYKHMIQFPNLGGGHFSFGVEKEWHSVADTPKQLCTESTGRYFTLNVSLLSCGLHTIPFYKRLDYPASMFTSEEIAKQNEAAELAERNYQQRVLQNSNRRTSAGQHKARTASAKSTTAPAVPAAVVEPPPATTDKPLDELDELLALTDTQLKQTTLNVNATTLPHPLPVVQPPTPSSDTTAASKNEVEHWLDSVLDE